MKKVRSVLLIWFFLMMLCFLGVIGNTKSSVWARSDAMGQVDMADQTAMLQQGESPDDGFHGGTVPITNTPEVATRDILVPLHDELAVSHGISLTYKTKGLGDPIETNLVIQSNASDGNITQMGPINGHTWRAKPMVWGNPISLTVEVTLVSSSLPVSWTGVAGIWAVNAENSGVTLIGTKQAITTELTVGKPFTDVIAARSTFTFTMRTTTKFGAAWGKVYSTKLTVYNGCSTASWLQNISSRDKFAMTVPSKAVTSYGTAPWDMRHIDGTGVILTSGTIFVPICGSVRTTAARCVYAKLYLPAHRPPVASRQRVRKEPPSGAIALRELTFPSHPSEITWRFRD